MPLSHYYRVKAQKRMEKERNEQRKQKKRTIYVDPVDDAEQDELDEINSGPGYDYSSLDEFYDDQRAFDPLDGMD